MDQAIRSFGGGSRVVEQLAPLLERHIRGDDRRPALIPTVDDLIEKISPADVEAQVTEFVDNQQMWARPSADSAAESAPGLTGDEVIEEIGGEHETNPEAGDLAEGIREMRLPDAGGPTSTTLDFLCTNSSDAAFMTRSLSIDAGYSKSSVSSVVRGKIPERFMADSARLSALHEVPRA